MLRLAYFSFLFALASSPLVFFGHSYARFVSLALLALTIALASIAFMRRE